jgi:signal transduction histidine kinase
MSEATKVLDLFRRSVETGRLATTTRRIVGAPGWPPTAAAILGSLAVTELVLRAGGSSGSIGDVSIALLLGLGATVPLALAYSYLPAAAMAITAATLLTLVAGHRTTGAGLAAQLAVGYLLGLRRPPWLWVPMLLPFVAYAVAGPTGVGGVRSAAEGAQLGLPLGDGRLSAVLLTSLLTAATGLGWVRRVRREATDRDASRRATADSLLEHAARGERARIARELHDVVAHHVSMIVVQAETARLTTPGMPTEGARRLVAIADTARDALTEMRRLLGVLREDAGAETTRKPQPAITQLVDLVDEARDAAGAGVRLLVRGPVAPLDPGVELTAYRIIQEALTNARRHAPGAAVDVELHYTDDAVRLRVRDNGPGPPDHAGRAGTTGHSGRAGTTGRSGHADATGHAGHSGRADTTGHGLLGMRERAAMVGGELRTGPAPASGFIVEARLPKSTGHEAVPRGERFPSQVGTRDPVSRSDGSAGEAETEGAAGAAG